jgi:hypothetical protein
LWGFLLAVISSFYRTGLPKSPFKKGGELKADGPPRAIQKNPEVIAAYLGTDWQG